DAALGVAGVLCELTRRGRLDDLPAHPAREADPAAPGGGPGIAQRAQRILVATELEADLLEDRVGVLLDGREAFLVEDLERRELPGQERDPLRVRGEPDRLARGTATTAPARRLVGRHDSSL